MNPAEQRADEPCPKCGWQLSHHEIDVGVGIIEGPAFCEACGWFEPERDYGLIEEDFL